MAHSILEDLSEQAFTESTIKRMYALIDRAKTDAEFQKLIYGIVNAAMPGQWKDYKRELSTIFNWFKKNIDYRRDPYGVELLQDVWATLDRKRGDCDDATTFMAAAAEILGSPARIVTVSTRANKDPNHVYAEAFVGGRWNGLDATVPQSYVGWAPPQVTARRIWTRKELGLAGGDDMDGIEGLGMSDNGYGNDGFRTNMRPVSRLLAPGVPDDISHTYGSPMPGTTDISGRKIWRAPVANNSDWTSNPRPGGGVYNPALPIAKRPLPQDLWYLVDRKYVPKVLNPDSAWWGKVPTSTEDVARMFPGSETSMAHYLKDIASVPASAIDEVAQDVREQLAMGELNPADVPAAIMEGLEGYALGRMPRMKLAPGQRPRRKAGKNSIKRIAPVRERQYLVPAPSKCLVQKNGGYMRGLGNLGDTIDDAAKLLSAQISSGQVPSSPSAITSAINAVVGVITGQPAGTPVKAADVAKSAIPVGMLAALGLTAWLLTKGGSPKYKRNPSRRRGRSRGGRRGGGFDMKTALLWGGGGLAAYMLLLRPGAPLMPASLAAKLPATGAPTTMPSLITAGVKAIPGIFDSISKLFGSGSSTPAPAPTSPGIVTSYDQLLPAPAPAPQSEFITSYA